MQTVGCTVVARNYLSYAQVAGDGWLRFHPGSRFVVLVIDDDQDRHTSDADRTFLSPGAIGIPERELSELRGIYSAHELTCALKPRFLRFLLGEGAKAIVFLDSDTDIHGSLDQVAELAARSGTALSPILLKPPPLDGRAPSELEVARGGMYNTGLIAVGSEGAGFLDWWAAWSRWDFLFDEAVGMHADQRWLDWVPLYFEHAVIRDAAVNVAHWNLHERRMGYSDGRFTVNGAPLTTFHFAGFDPLDPQRVSQYLSISEVYGAPFRVDCDGASLARLCREYADKLISAGYEENRKTPYGFDRSAAGTGLGPWERRVYREALLAAEARGDRGVPGPFDPARSAEFERLLTHPRSTGLFSEAALTRLADSRVVIDGGGWDRRRIRDAVQSRLARGLLVRRPPWMPHVLPSDRIRAEYWSH